MRIASACDIVTECAGVIQWSHLRIRGSEFVGVRHISEVILFSKEILYCTEILAIHFLHLLLDSETVLLDWHDIAVRACAYTKWQIRVSTHRDLEILAHHLLLDVGTALKCATYYAPVPWRVRHIMTVQVPWLPQEAFEGALRLRENLPVFLNFRGDDIFNTIQINEMYFKAWFFSSDPENTPVSSEDFSIHWKPFRTFVLSSVPGYTPVSGVKNFSCRTMKSM